MSYINHKFKDVDRDCLYCKWSTIIEEFGTITHIFCENKKSPYWASEVTDLEGGCKYFELDKEKYERYRS